MIKIEHITTCKRIMWNTKSMQERIVSVVGRLKKRYKLGICCITNKKLVSAGYYDILAQYKRLKVMN